MLNPWRDFKKLKISKPIHTATLLDLKRLYPFLPPYLQWAAKTAFFLALRPGMVELFSLKWDAFDFRRGIVSIRQGKTGNIRCLSEPCVHARSRRTLCRRFQARGSAGLPQQWETRSVLPENVGKGVPTSRGQFKVLRCATPCRYRNACPWRRPCRSRRPTRPRIGNDNRKHICARHPGGAVTCRITHACNRHRTELIKPWCNRGAFGAVWCKKKGLHFHVSP